LSAIRRSAIPFQNWPANQSTASAVIPDRLVLSGGAFVVFLLPRLVPAFHLLINKNVSRNAWIRLVKHGVAGGGES